MRYILIAVMFVAGCQATTRPEHLTTESGGDALIITPVVPTPAFLSQVSDTITAQGSVLGPIAYWTPIPDEQLTATAYVESLPTLTPRPTYTYEPTYTPYPTATPTVDEMYHWTKLTGPWGGSWYTDDNGDLRHGAAANGIVVEDAANPGNVFPLYVNDTHYGIALPSAAFYGLPVKICFRGACQIATAVDVMRHPRVCHSDWECYNMIDLWPATKKALDFPDIFYDTTGLELQVYIGKLKEYR